MGKWCMLSEDSSVKGSPEDKQACVPFMRESVKISWQVTLALYTRGLGPPDPKIWGPHNTIWMTNNLHD